LRITLDEIRSRNKNRQIPEHVGIIPDGNRRWARKHGWTLYRTYIHGYDKLVEITRYLNKKGIRMITVYALSYDNCLRRSPAEKSIIEKVAIKALRDLRMDPELEEKDIRVSVIGDPILLSKSLHAEARSTVMETHKRKGGQLTIALCYSGRWEVEKYIMRGMTPPSLQLSPIDLIIRTGGMRRISGFFPLLIEYAELYFLDIEFLTISAVRLG
jgi:tritrans,polycis-undecaprenyl-diphosphate synthase [geranylgeranyl-diphosphate specific]